MKLSRRIRVDRQLSARLDFRWLRRCGWTRRQAVYRILARYGWTSTPEALARAGAQQIARGDR